MVRAVMNGSLKAAAAERDAARAAFLARHPSHTAETTWGRVTVLQTQDTKLDAALTVAHAVWPLPVSPRG
jgi:hypothetical protein